MRKVLKRIGFVALLAALVWTGALLADRQRLSRDLVRLHVVAASDSADAQEQKLMVRDAVLESLRQGLEDLTDVEQAKEYIRQHLPELERIANEVLSSAGSGDRAAVSLTEEAFPTREYDTFSLPAGIYESLRIVIGEGEGHNWWCVVFPELCLPATVEGFEDAAEAGGFPGSLTGALSGEDGYQIRFFFLDLLGKVENFFHGG